MNDKIQQAIIDFHEVLKGELGSNVTAVKVFISNHEYDFDVMAKSPAQLKQEGVSMRNIRGEWIK
jgi:hypothetical protein